ncbi:MAG: hypothetical protein IIZ92_10150 [Aquincola sp.]|nr:hypothetical protein [Aquincola sp.]
MTTPTPPKRRGRPPSGQALSSTERSRLLRADRAAAKMRRVTVFLTPEAAQALDVRVRLGETQDQAVSSALLGK